MISVAVFAALAGAAPWLLANDYYLSVLTIAFLNAIVVIGLNLLLGYAGQISLGHGAFYGLGAYATAFATATLGWPVWAGMVCGVVLAAIVAWLIGIPTLKLHGNYLAMATLGFGLIVYIVFNEAVEVTGGPSGFVGIPALSLFGWEPETDLEYYRVMVVAVALVAALSLNLISSKVGRALKAIHTSERAAQSAGIDIARYKLGVFVISAAFAGLAGTLYAHYLTFVAPSSFGFHSSVLFIVMVVLGGMSNVWGAVAGAVFLTVLPEALRSFEEVETIIYGGILIVCMMFVPDGLVGGAGRLVRAVLRREGGHA